MALGDSLTSHGSIIGTDQMDALYYAYVNRNTQMQNNVLGIYNYGFNFGNFGATQAQLPKAGVDSRSSKRTIERLRDEITNWHGNILEK